MILFIKSVFLFSVGMFLLVNPVTTAADQIKITPKDLVAPLSSKLKYPLTKNESISCGRWGNKSQDYPYFGAPRDRNTRNHAGVDIYPQEGVGAPVKALADGTIIKIAPFYTRANGEVTYGVLVNHGDFVVNYAELKRPDIKVAAVIKQGQKIGVISGTKQLHFELYTKGTTDWLRWYGKQPDNLIDPTDMLLTLFSKNR